MSDATLQFCTTAILFSTLTLGLVTAILAMRKEYNFWLWWLGGGLVALMVLAFLPHTWSGSPEQRRGNRIGAALATGTVVAVVTLVLVARLG